MNIIEFYNRFPDEDSCRLYLKEQREEAGITCKVCSCKDHYWLQTVEKWKCKNCGSRTNLRSGTIMEKSKLPLRYWFITTHLLTSTKKSFSALEIQRQLGHKRYEPIWLMVNKIRIVMGKRDAQYTLAGEIEIDDAFFETVTLSPEDTIKKNKRGRGSDKQSKVLVMVESRPNPNNTSKHKPSKSMGYVKMIVVNSVQGKDIHYEITKAINKNATAVTDGYPAYNDLSNLIAEHDQRVVPSKEAHITLPWVHTVISNAKRLLLGVHHSVGNQYLQNYLNEYCYKLNRRHMNGNLFDRIISVGANNTWY